MHSNADLTLRLAVERHAELTRFAAESRMARGGCKSRPALERIRSIRRHLAA
jgi:hypothetical protein